MASGNEVLGSAVMFYVGGSYVAMNCETDLTITQTAKNADGASKCDAGLDVWVPIGYSLGISGSGTLQAGDTGTELARDGIMQVGGSVIAYKVKTINSEMVSGSGVFNSLTYNAVNGEICKYSFDFAGSGAQVWGAV